MTHIWYIFHPVCLFLSPAYSDYAPESFSPPEAFPVCPLQASGFPGNEFHPFYIFQAHFDYFHRKHNLFPTGKNLPDAVSDGQFPQQILWADSAAFHVLSSDCQAPALHPGYPFPEIFSLPQEFSEAPGFLPIFLLLQTGFSVFPDAENTLRIPFCADLQPDLVSPILSFSPRSLPEAFLHPGGFH